MKACNIGKTIIVWDKLDDHQISELLSVLKNIILVYRKNISILTKPISIPIPLKQNNNFISIIKKHNEILISMNKYKNNIDFSPILNGDILYESLGILKNPEYYIVSKIKTFLKYSKNEWFNLPYNQAFELYALTPNIEPIDFIENLRKGTLSNYQKQFLENIGIALQEKDYSEGLKNTIKEANELFEER